MNDAGASRGRSYPFKRCKGGWPAARASVDAAKIALGERGSVGWDDGTEFDRHLVANTPYAQWYLHIEKSDSAQRSCEDGNRSIAVGCGNEIGCRELDLELRKSDLPLQPAATLGRSFGNDIHHGR